MWRLLLFAGLMLLTPGAEAAENWYYCDTSHAYYPYVTECSVPWREVVPSPNAPSSSSAQPPGITAAKPEHSAANQADLDVRTCVQSQVQRQLSINPGYGSHVSELQANATNLCESAAAHWAKLAVAERQCFQRAGGRIDELIARLIPPETIGTQDPQAAALLEHCKEQIAQKNASSSHPAASTPDHQAASTAIPPKTGAPTEAAQQPKQAVATSSMITVEISLGSALADGKLEGSTNLPEGTALSASLVPKAPDCAPNCTPWMHGTTVAAGHFEIGPFQTLKPGPYTLTVSTPLADLQPANVQAIIGANGEKMRGPYVKNFHGLGYVAEITASINLGGDEAASLSANQDHEPGASASSNIATNNPDKSAANPGNPPTDVPDSWINVMDGNGHVVGRVPTYKFCNKQGFGLSTSGLTLVQQRECYDAIHTSFGESVGDPNDRAMEDAAAKSPIPPAYCKPGYGLADAGLTKEQRLICSATLIPQVERVGTCEGSPGACEQMQKEREDETTGKKSCDLRMPWWRDCFGPSVTVEADNGQIYRAFTDKHVSGRTSLGMELLVYIEQQLNAPYIPSNLHRFAFDCRGDYMDVTALSGFEYAPPQSVAGRLSAIACALP